MTASPEGLAPSALDLTGRVALVTGAARGLGRAEALALARRGARIVAADALDASEVVDSVRVRGGKAVQVAADLSRPEAARRALAACLDMFGDLHVVVNNAGLIRDRMSFNITDDDWADVLAVNLSAPFYLGREAARYWRERCRAGDSRPRVIINTSSESGLYGNAGQANYAAAKAGVAALTLTLAAELKRYGIRVNAIAPRARTPMSAQAFGELPRTASFDPFGPEHVAEVVAWLASEAAFDVTGQLLVVHGTGIQVLRPWSAGCEIHRRARWSDNELLALRCALFPDGMPSRAAQPIASLFTSPADDKEPPG
jgi:NAD(P)-dependent dehydrogenase (short-subunit alcohol dehydrogenase family)